MDSGGLLPSQFDEYKGRDVFDLFDLDGDGVISAKELGKVLRAVGQNPTDKCIQTILKKADKNGTQVIEYDEYLEILKDFRKDPQEVEIELREAFRMFDKDRNNNLDFVELRKVLTTLGEPLSNQEAIEFCSMMDVNKDNKVDVEEFVKFMCKRY